MGEKLVVVGGFAVLFMTGYEENGRRGGGSWFVRVIEVGANGCVEDNVANGEERMTGLGDDLRRMATREVGEVDACGGGKS